MRYSLKWNSSERDSFLDERSHSRIDHHRNCLRNALNASNESKSPPSVDDRGRSKRSFVPSSKTDLPFTPLARCPIRRVRLSSWTNGILFMHSLNERITNEKESGKSRMRKHRRTGKSEKNVSLSLSLSAVVDLRSTTSFFNRRQPRSRSHGARDLYRRVIRDADSQRNSPWRPTRTHWHKRNSWPGGRSRGGARPADRCSLIRNRVSRGDSFAVVINFRRRIAARVQRSSRADRESWIRNIPLFGIFEIFEIADRRRSASNYQYEIRCAVT